MLSLCFISARRHYYVSGKHITQALLHVTAVVSEVDSGISDKFCKISSKMQKNVALFLEGTLWGMRIKIICYEVLLTTIDSSVNCFLCFFVA